jgi:hypothetical protein
MIIKKDIPILYINKVEEESTKESKTLNEPDKIDFVFYWRGFTPVKSHPIDQKIISEIHKQVYNGIYLDEQLKYVGDLMWQLFPQEIQMVLKEFDLDAMSLYKRSESTLPIIIYTDVLDIPWELCITLHGKKQEIKKSYRELYDKDWLTCNWFKKYLVATQIIGVPKCMYEEVDKEREKVLLVVNTSKEFDDLGFLEMHENKDFKEEYAKLTSLIDKLTCKKGVSIELCKCPSKPEDKFKLYNKLKHCDYDLVLYLGSYKHKTKENDEEGIPVYDPQEKRLDYFDVREINITGEAQPLIFLDACRTSIQIAENEVEESDNKVKRFNLSYNLPKHFLDGRASAYIGTFQWIEPVVATAFAKNFLHSVYMRGYDLSRAMYDARIKTGKYFKEKFDETGKVFYNRFCVECSSFSLYGSNEGILVNPFRRKRDKLRILYPKMIGQYFTGFKDEIYSSSIPEISIEEKDDLEEVAQEIETSDTQFLADLSILHATELIHKYRDDKDKKLVIVGALFRLKRGADDCSLYFIKDKKLDKCRFLDHPDHLSAVSVMALSYLRKFEHFEKKGRRKVTEYKNIYSNVMNSLKDNDDEIEPFVLATVYKEKFDREIKEKGWDTKFETISLYDNFRDIIKGTKYEFSGDIPAEILVTRRKDIGQDKELFKEVFTTWAAWKKWEETGGVEDKFLSTQNVIYFFDEEDREATKKFSEFVCNELSGVLPDDVKPLKNEDFLPIRPWIENWEEFCDKQKKCLDLLVGYYKKEIEPLEQKSDSIKEKIETDELDGKLTEHIKEQLRDIELKIAKRQEKYDRFKKEIKRSMTLDELNSIYDKIKKEVTK